MATSLSVSWPRSNTWFLRPIGAHSPNGISISSAVFAQMTAECPYTLQCDVPSPSKLPLPMGDLGPHLILVSLGPPESSTQTASRSEQPLLQGSLVWQTDRPTDVLMLLSMQHVSWLCACAVNVVLSVSANASLPRLLLRISATSHQRNTSTHTHMARFTVDMWTVWRIRGKIISTVLCCVLPSLRWHCWFGGKKSIWPVNIRVMRCWRGYLYGARCKWFTYGPADATATPSSFASLKSRMI